jgi:Sigma-70, region 4
MDMIRSLQHKFPHLTEEEADLAFVNAVIRCLSNGDYLRFDPDHLSLKGGFGLIARSCAEHLLRPFMLPAPTRTKPDRQVRVKCVGLPEENDEGEYHIPKVYWYPDMTDALMRIDWVQKGLSGLSEKDRRAIHVYFWDELRGAELANVLGVSEDHAKKPANRAMRQLRYALSALVEEPHGSSL